MAVAKVGRKAGDGKGRLGGRVKGTPNKVTKVTKEMVQEFLDENFEEAMVAWHKIDKPGVKFAAYLKMMEFVLPKMASVDFNPGDKTPDWMRKLNELRQGK